MQISPTLATPDALEKYTQLASHPLHSSSKPGIMSIDIHQTKVILSLPFHGYSLAVFFGLLCRHLLASVVMKY